MCSVQEGRQGVGAARLIFLLALALFAAPASAQEPVIGLITKTESNPFFVKMREGAQAAARSNGARLLTAAGKNDADNAGQVTAIENMIAAGAKVILITVNDSKAIVPAIKRAMVKTQEGVPVLLEFITEKAEDFSMYPIK